MADLKIWCKIPESVYIQKGPGIHTGWKEISEPHCFTRLSEEMSISAGAGCTLWVPFCLHGRAPWALNQGGTAEMVVKQATHCYRMQGEDRN